MLVKLDVCSPNHPGIGKSDDNFDRIHDKNSEVCRGLIQHDAEKRHASSDHENQAKRRRLELGLPTATDGQGESLMRNPSPRKNSTTFNVKEVDYDEQLGFLEGHDFDIFNTDDDRQELMDYCERMLEEWYVPDSL